jgi:hypothetical protein
MPEAKTYYVDVPPHTVRTCWEAFEHELNSPAGSLLAEFDAADSATRTRVRLAVADAKVAESLDEAMRRFRLFLVSRGVVRA